MEDEPQDAYLPNSDLERLQPFDVREQSSRKGMFMLLGGFLFLLALAFVILKLFSAGTRDRDQTPRILAEAEPYKEVPLERGGDETPNQDKEIYDVLNGTATTEEVTVVPASEEPMPRPAAKEVELPQAEPEKPAANIVIKERNPAPQNEAVVETPKPVAVTPKPTKPRAGASSDFVVQIASLRSQSEASALWDRLSDKLGDVINSTHYSDIKRVDLDAKGIYYRLRITGFADKDGASALCSQLKARDQDCIVTKK